MQSKHLSRKLSLQLFCLLLLLFIFQSSEAWLGEKLSPYLFGSFQSSRISFFKQFTFSLGDIIYSVFLLLLMYRLVRLIRFGRRYTKEEWLIWVLISVRFLLIVYLVIFLLWGLQYTQPKLSERLQLQSDAAISDQQIIAYDSVLIQRLNATVKFSQPVAFPKLNTIVGKAYSLNGENELIFAKYSLFGSLVGYMGATGYFNPITGEAQAITGSPDFMIPYLLAHEMAHQTGIAAEDDANLIAYIRCVESKDSNLFYSASFNLWLYAHRKVWKIDSNIANHLKSSMNAISIKHLDTLREWNRQTSTILDKFTDFFFDAYLRSSNQKEGIKSYRSVLFSAYLWEQKKRMKP